MTVKNIPFGKPILGEEEIAAVTRVLEGPQLVHGPVTKAFEKDFSDYCGGPATSLASCTAGLHLFYLALGIGEGDEVIVPAQTHVATAHAVVMAGATPVFVDAEPRYGNIDPDAVKAAVTDRTRAITLVHFLGMPCDMDAIMDIARQHDLAVIEDCALAIGAKWKDTHCGLVGTGGAFSFYPVKHMTTIEGGMAICRDENLLYKMDRMKALGVDRQLGERKIPGIYDVTMPGLNYRMNEVEAAIGIEQLKRLPGFLAARRKNAIALRKHLQEIDEITLFDPEDTRRKGSDYCFSVILRKGGMEARTELLKSLQAQGVGASVYYPGPVPLFTWYKEKFGYRDGQFPIAEKISNMSIALSVAPHLGEEDMEDIAQALKKALETLQNSN